MTQLELEPARTIDPSGQVTHIPGVDAHCPGGRGHDCQWPFCPCSFPDRSEGDENG